MNISTLFIAYVHLIRPHKSFYIFRDRKLDNKLLYTPITKIRIIPAVYLDYRMERLEITQLHNQLRFYTSTQYREKKGLYIQFK